MPTRGCNRPGRVKAIADVDRRTAQWLLAVGFMLLIAACSAGSNSFGQGNSTASPYQFGPYDGPQGYHGGVFSG